MLYRFAKHTWAPMSVKPVTNHMPPALQVNEGAGAEAHALSSAPLEVHDMPVERRPMGRQVRRCIAYAFLLLFRQLCVALASWCHHEHWSGSYRSVSIISAELRTGPRAQPLQVPICPTPYAPAAKDAHYRSPCLNKRHEQSGESAGGWTRAVASCGWMSDR